MKRILKHEYLPWLTIFCGGIGLGLRLWLLGTEDEKGFIARGHISEILLLGLTAVFLAALIFACRGLSQGGKYRFNFPASRIAAGGTALFAVCIAMASGADLFGMTDILGKLCAVLGALSAAALVFVAWCRYSGRQPNSLFHVVACSFLMLRLICLYRGWSADPQLEDYCFPLLALVCAMLATYERATFDANFGKRGRYTLFSLACVYFCCISLAELADRVFYGVMGLWMITNQCNLRPIAPQPPEEV